MLTLYYARDTISLATLIVLEEVGADYAAQRIDFARTEQRSPDYLRINPKGRMPALVTEHGILTETPALLVYVAQAFGRPDLALLHDPFAFARVQAVNSYFCSGLHINHAHRMRGPRWVDAGDQAAIAAMQRHVPVSVGANYDYIESEVLKGPWVMGERYTICDPYLFTLAQWLEQDGVDPQRIPKVMDHRQRMSERAAVKKALGVESGDPTRKYLP
jgi:glutathione S-transferase